MTTRRRGRRNRNRSLARRFGPRLVVVSGAIVGATVAWEAVPWAVAAVGAAAVMILLVRLWWRLRRRRARLGEMRSLRGLLALSPAEFEFAVADLFRARGYDDIHRVGGAGDLGVDLIGRDREGCLVIVQCKRYGRENRVGSPAIQSFIGMAVHHRAERGVVVTTSSYTLPATRLAAQAPLPITLIDGTGLVRLASRAHDDARDW